MSSLPDISVALGWKPGPVDKELDENVLTSKYGGWPGLPFWQVELELPPGTKVLSISPSGASAWVQTVRVETVLPDERQVVYFMKVGMSSEQCMAERTGVHGIRMLI